MADDVPPALKQADVSLYKTATRAAQLQTAKPIMAYWCEYWVVNQILAKKLHNTDNGILEYTTTLMDKLEQAKTEYAGEEAITDDATAQAYVEQFAQECLDRAERVIKANMVTHNTANTFDAALTFFNLVNIWGPPDAETQQKTKYAKWNAARIIKAIKEGSDPNESNPKIEEAQQPPLALSPNDPDVQMLDSAAAGQEHNSRQASVEDAPDVDLHKRAPASPPLLPFSPAPAAPPPTAPHDVDLHLPSAPSNPAGTPAAPPPGYFDPPTSEEVPSPIPPPSHDPITYQPPQSLRSAPGAIAPTPPAVAPTFPPPSGQSAPPPEPPTFAPSPHATAAVAPPPISPPGNSIYTGMTPTPHASRPTISLPSNPSASAFAAPGAGLGQPVPQAAPARGNLTADDMAMAQAQKHAKWAISALNFEDVPTAVRELRRALEALGAS